MMQRFWSVLAVNLGKRAGLTDDEIERVQVGPGTEGWSARERAILGAVDQLHEKQDIDDDTWAALREHLDETATIELLMLVGHYEMLATFLQTLRIEPDRRR